MRWTVNKGITHLFLIAVIQGRIVSRYKIIEWVNITVYSDQNLIKKSWLVEYLYKSNYPRFKKKSLAVTWRNLEDNTITCIIVFGV